MQLTIKYTNGALDEFQCDTFNFSSDVVEFHVIPDVVGRAPQQVSRDAVTSVLVPGGTPGNVDHQIIIWNRNFIETPMSISGPIPTLRANPWIVFNQPDGSQLYMDDASVVRIREN